MKEEALEIVLNLVKDQKLQIEKAKTVISALYTKEEKKYEIPYNAKKFCSTTF